MHYATHVVAPQNHNVVFESMVVSHMSMVASDGSSLEPQANHLVNDHSQQSGTWSTASLLCLSCFSDKYNWLLVSKCKFSGQCICRRRATSTIGSDSFLSQEELVFAGCSRKFTHIAETLCRQIVYFLRFYFKDEIEKRKRRRVS